MLEFVQHDELLNMTCRRGETLTRHSRILKVGLVACLAAALSTSIALAAPPPQAIVVTSGRSVLQGALAGTITLPDGEIVTEDLTTLLAPYALLESDLLLWDVASGSVRSANTEPMLLPYGWASAYRSGSAQLDLARIEPPANGQLGQTRLSLPVGTKFLAAWLGEPGTVVVFNPLIGVPEPGFATGYKLLLLAFVLLGRHRLKA